MAGFILFGIHWFFWTVDYFFVIRDPFNGAFTAGGFILLFYLAYHEFLDHIWEEESASLKWLAGIVFFAGMAYYLIQAIPQLAAAMIYPVAWLSASIMNVLGLNPVDGQLIALGEINYLDPTDVSIPLHYAGAPISIILACTAIQAIIIFAAVILFTPVERRERLKVLGVNVGVIYPLNIVRNIATIWLVGAWGWDFEVVHGTYGKIFSLLILMALAYYTFMKIPEILDNIYDLFDLRFRNKPGMIVDGYMVLPKKDESIDEK
jgi:archaeosortase A (PGF-CTERM-specific)